MQKVETYEEFNATPGNSVSGGLCFRCYRVVPANKKKCGSKKCREFVKALKKSHVCSINGKLIVVKGAIPYAKVCSVAELPEGSTVVWSTRNQNYKGDLKKGEFLGVCGPFNFTVTEFKDEAVV